MENVTADLLQSLGPSYLTDPVHLGTAQGQTGALRFFNSSSVLFTGFQAGNTTAELTYTLPTAGPAVSGSHLASTTAGVLSWFDSAAAFAPIGAAFVTIGNTSSLTAERALTGTSNQIIVTDNGANSTVVLSTPQNIHTGATPTFASLTLSATSNQLVLGTTNTTTITSTAPSASRVYTISDVGANASFVMTEAAQTIAGAKTFQLATAGSIETLAVRHTDNTDVGSHARLQVRTGGSAGGDPYVYFDDNTAGDWSLGLDNSDSNRFKLCQSSVLGTNDFWSVDLNGNIVPGSAALATNATNGFLYIPTCAGTPTGVPTAYTGRVPIIFDTTNNKLYIYDGSWLGGTTPGAWV